MRTIDPNQRALQEANRAAFIACRRRPLRGFLFAVILFVACLVVMAIGVTSSCAHQRDADQLAMARARCDRDGGQWTIEYDLAGRPTRCSCVLVAKD